MGGSGREGPGGGYVDPVQRDWGGKAFPDHVGKARDGRWSRALSDLLFEFRDCRSYSLDSQLDAFNLGFNLVNVASNAK